MYISTDNRYRPLEPQRNTIDLRLAAIWGIATLSERKDIALSNLNRGPDAHQPEPGGAHAAGFGFPIASMK